MNLPQEFKDKMTKLLGTTASDFFASLESPPQKAITLNTCKISKEDFEKVADFEFSPIEKVDNGYYTEDFKIGKHILSHLGLIYSQEPSAMYPVEMLDIRPGDIVLDLCASPGGKSIQILEKLNGTGLLVSNEIVYNRAKVLYENLNRMGFNNFAITCNSPKDFENLDIKFDKILVDAPCGGEGMFRKNDFEINNYNPDTIPTNAKRQMSILNSISPLLKNGGTLVYSTCTYDTRENEEIVANFLKENKDFQIEYRENFGDITSPGIKIEGFDTDKTYRRYPHLHRGEGQYMAVLKKSGNDNNDYSSNLKAKNYITLSRKEQKLLEDTFKDVADISNLDIYNKNDTFFAIPDTTIDFEDLNVLSIGTVIGNRDKTDFKIHHNFYHTFGDMFYNKIELDNIDAYKYLHGETINTDYKNGICVVTYLNTPIGGGKVTNGIIKNYYPKYSRTALDPK